MKEKINLKKIERKSKRKNEAINRSGKKKSIKIKYSNMRAFLLESKEIRGFEKNKKQNKQKTLRMYNYVALSSPLVIMVWTIGEQKTKKPI